MSQIALVESVWVLGRLFDADDESIERFVTHLLEARELVIENQDGARQALAATRGRAEFADAVLAQAGRAAGCDYTVTFDSQSPVVVGMQLAT